jgi:hypothetical protein
MLLTTGLLKRNFFVKKPENPTWKFVFSSPITCGHHFYSYQAVLNRDGLRRKRYWHSLPSLNQRRSFSHTKVGNPWFNPPPQ